MKGTTNCYISDAEKFQTVKISIITDQDEHSALIGAIINVSYLNASTQYIWDGNDVILSIPADVAYTVSASKVDGFATPANQTFDASQTIRIVTMTYIKFVNGVYVYDTDNKLISPSLWNTTNNSKAVGVAIITDNCQFVVAKADIGTKVWGNNRDVSTLTNYTDATLAATDFDGVNNTSKIIAALGSSNASAACVSYIFLNGKAGYLGSAGEWQAARNNKEALNNALTLIGGTAIGNNNHWTSTEYSSSYTWLQSFNSTSNLTYGDKGSAFYVRAFLAL